MTDEKHIEKLAELSRISISPEERDGLKKDIESILSYVEQIRSVSAESAQQREKTLVRNIMREDIHPHQTGMYTEELLQAAPRVKDGFVEVKKIIDQIDRE